MDEIRTGAKGWVDTHIHILPGLDDGADNMDEALAMANIAIQDGIVAVIATPHANYSYEYDHERVAQRAAELQQRIGTELKIMSGCEMHLSLENVNAARQRPRLYTLNGSRYLLVEFPELFEGRVMSDVLDSFRKNGIVPVLAHPERNPVFQRHPETLHKYLRLGCITQLTASSFSGRFGKRAQEFSRELLDDELVHVISSDAHSTRSRTPQLSEVRNLIARWVGEEIANALARDNPRAMSEDKDLVYLPDPPEAPKKKSRWAIFR